MTFTRYTRDRHARHPGDFIGHSGTGPASFADVLKAAEQRRKPPAEPQPTPRQLQWERDKQAIREMERQAHSQRKNCACDDCEIRRDQEKSA